MLKLLEPQSVEQILSPIFSDRIEILDLSFNYSIALRKLIKQSCNPIYHYSVR